MESENVSLIEGICLQLGANVLFEFENVFLIGGIYFFQFGGNWGQMGANVLVEFKNVFFYWGHFLIIEGKWGKMC